MLTSFGPGIPLVVSLRGLGAIRVIIVARPRRYVAWRDVVLSFHDCVDLRDGGDGVRASGCMVVGGMSPDITRVYFRCYYLLQGCLCLSEGNKMSMSYPHATQHALNLGLYLLDQIRVLRWLWC